MSDDRTFERAMQAWLESGSDRTPPAAVDAVLLAVRTTPQERGMRAPWRTPDMNTPMRLAAAFAAVAVLGVAGLLYLNRGPGVGVTATASPPAVVAPSPTATSAPRQSLPADVTGLIAFSRVANGLAAIMVTRPDGTGMTALFAGPGNNVQPAWSPDGSRIAWATENGIRLAQADGRGVVQLTEDRRDRDPAWSPDGTSIVFASNRDGDFEIYVVPVNGGDLTQLTDNDAEDTHPSWSAADDAIAFSSDRAGTSDIWTMDPSGQNVRQLTTEGGADDAPAWSPDGSRIAFTSDRDGGTPFVYLMNADGSGLTRLLTAGEVEHDPAWSPDGRYLALTKPQSGTGAAIYIVDVTTHRVVGTLGKERAEFNYPAWKP
jgi:Tol biopolymer transport system component